MDLDYLDILPYLKNEFSNEIPEEIIHSDNTNSKYKVRKSWFQAVVAEAENIITEGYASERTRQMYVKFIDECKKTDFSNRPTIKEDIDLADKLLVALLDDLQNVRLNSN